LHLAQTHLEMARSFETSLTNVRGKAFVVEEKLVASKIGRALRLRLDLRNKARYDPHARLVESEATEVTKLAEEMIGVLEKELYQ
jgi:hypothetical protein